MKNFSKATFKNFSKGTILGLTLGVFLAAYAAFGAWISPTAVPPGGNVDAPVNVGVDDQIKIGGLLQVKDFWVNNAMGVTGGAAFGGDLMVGGSVRVGEFASLPTCDSANVGKFVFSTAVDKPAVCASSGWKVFEISTDADLDGVFASLDCNDADDTLWQYLTGYDNADGDAYFNDTSSQVCSGASLPTEYRASAGTDCLDSDADVFQSVDSLSSDNDQDGHTDTSAATRCVGTSATVSGRTYYKDTSASLAWLTDSQKLGTSDCDDACSTCFSGSTATTAYTDGLDQDCNGTIDDLVISTKICGSAASTSFTTKTAAESRCDSYCTSVGKSFGSLSCGSTRLGGPGITSRDFHFAHCDNHGSSGTGTSQILCKWSGAMVCTCNSYR